MYHTMKTIARHAAASLLETLHFTGLSGEQVLLATIVSENPFSDPHVSQRAKSLLLLDGGATAAEVRRSVAMSRRSLADLIQRFRTGGLCAALLGLHASQARRAWLTLSPSSQPRVQLQLTDKTPKRVIDNAVPAATSTAKVISAPLSPTRQACCCNTDNSPADPHHQGGQV
ncbi:MAG: hypothetical protein JWR15_531 [Prosthecobacter sp.]|nr:hypothetical protein [Prosthecobacter sp.]